MAQRRLPPQGSGGRDSRPHHIASIAHHFFDDDAAETGALRHRQRELAVSSPTSGPLAAWVSASLGKSLAHESVILGESPWLTWSATSYIPKPQLQPLDGLGAAADNIPGDRFWQISRPAEQANARKKGANPAGEARIMLRHLGALNNQQLSELEAVHLTSNPAPAALPGGDALVWCLQPTDALAMGATYTLGRVVALLRPDFLEILVIDPAWIASRKSTATDASEPLLERCRQLVRAACPDQQVQFNHLPYLGQSDPELATRTFRSLGARLLNGNSGVQP